ncbi:unnamed protein product [Trichobilharzia regenti]|nr:unnamed protein product [Trichobilharzia regenti]
MRLNRPTFVRQQCEPAELYLDDIAGCLTAADAGIRGNLDGIALNFLSTGNMPTSAAANSDEHLSNTDNKVNVDKRNYDSFQPKVGGFSELLSLPHSFGSHDQIAFHPNSISRSRRYDQLSLLTA